MSQVKAKSELKIYLSAGSPGMPVMVDIEKGKGIYDTSTYYASMVPADYGVGIKFEKIWDGRDFVLDDDEDKIRFVNIDDETGDNTCECKGFLRWGKCRHIQASLKLIESGLLKKSPRPEHADEMPGKAVAADTDKPFVSYCPECRKWSDGPLCENCSL